MSGLAGRHASARARTQVRPTVSDSLPRLPVTGRCSRRPRPEQADGSMRPFAPLQRLPVSGPPLPDRRSRPAPSPHCGVRANPSTSAFLSPVSGQLARTRVGCHAPRILDGSSPLRSPSGPFDPAGSSLAAIRRQKACLRRTPAVRPSPQRPDRSRRLGSPVPIRCVPRGSPAP